MKSLIGIFSIMIVVTLSNIKIAILPQSILFSDLVFSFIFFLMKADKILNKAKFSIEHILIMILFITAIAIHYFFSNHEDFKFALRMILVVVTAIGMQKLIGICGLSTQQFIFATLFGFIIAYFVFKLSNIEFYLNVDKAWLAVVPLLLLGLRRTEITSVNLVNILEAMTLFIVIVLIFESRSLAIGIVVFLLITISNNKGMFLLGIVCLSVSVALFFTLLSQKLFYQQDYSNLVRFTMILAAFGPENPNYILGPGSEVWRQNIWTILPDNRLMNFLPTANPHFLPIELYIKSGLLYFPFLIILFHYYYKFGRYAPVAVALVASSFFTTNTGVERLLLSTSICLILLTRSKINCYKNLSVNTL